MDQTSITADPSELLAMAEQDLALAEEALRDAVKEEQEAAAARVQSLGSILQKKADERVSLRSDIEQRWLKNIRQLNGIYEEADLPKKQDEGDYGSRVYVPLTRRLRNLVVARLADMSFPTDDRSWILKPSPKAELGDVSVMLSDVAPQAPVAVPGGPPVQASALKKAIDEVQKEAEIRASRMQRTVDDRLAECKWPAKARRALEDAVDLGTGVIKGPVPVLKRKKIYAPQPDGSVQMTVKDDVVPALEHVPLWNFYPDMSATDIGDATDVIEAHPMTRIELAALRQQPGFNAAAIDMVLASDPRPDNQTRRQDLRDLAGLSAAPDERYIVWEYNGPIKGSDLNACGRIEHVGVDEDGNQTTFEPEFDDDEDYQGVVWFADSVVIKAIVRPLDTEQSSLYSVIWWQRDSASIFGYGLPDEVRDQQASANGSFRAMLDNMGLTVGPQIVFDQDVIEPVDGRWKMSPFKMWRKKNPAASVQAAFGFYQIESRVSELGAIFDRSKSLIDEIATLPGFMAGQEQPAYMQSATGAAVAYNASTLWVRRFIRHWDDAMIEPTMSRMVEWEMDFNPDDSIKGDFAPQARGIASLVELEGMGNRMLQFAQLIRQMGLPLKDQYRTARKLAASLKLDPDEVLPTEDEIKQMKSGEQGPDIEQQKLDVAKQNNEMDHAAKMAELQEKAADRTMRGEEYARREKLALLQLASQERMTMEETARKYGYDLRRIEAEMAENDRQRAHEAQLMNAETALKLRTGSGV